MSRDWLLPKNAPRAKKLQNELIGNITHFHFSNKKLRCVRGDLEEEPLLGRLCPRLQAVYLNDNLFTKIA